MIKKATPEQLYEIYARDEHIDQLKAALTEAEQREAGLVEALGVARIALTHDTPGDCWSTGPATGNHIEDLIVCPGCRALNYIEQALAQPSPGAERVRALVEATTEAVEELENCYGRETVLTQKIRVVLEGGSEN